MRLHMLASIPDGPFLPLVLNLMSLPSRESNTTEWKVGKGDSDTRVVERGG